MLMRLFCSNRWRDAAQWVVCGAASFAGGLALAPGQAGAQTLMPPPEPVLRLVSENPTLAFYPRDIVAIDISESGGITDMFVRLSPEDGRALAELTRLSLDAPFRIMACEHILLDTSLRVPNEGASLYLPNTTAVRAEAIRALWHGRRTCETLDPGALPDGE